ncbi:hypothetical protein E5D57_005089 [Metarhizium anisopliae]|nr:hypothetical protein E5D57_005089 [Metarhizium anisopliae]
MTGHSLQHTHKDAIAAQRYRPGPKDLDSGMMAHEADLLRIVVHRDGRIPLIASWSGLYEWAQLDRRVIMTRDWVWEALNKLLCLVTILQPVPRSLQTKLREPVALWFVCLGVDRRTFELAHESMARDDMLLEWTRGRASKTMLEAADGIKFHLDAVYAVRRPGAHQAERQA